MNICTEFHHYYQKYSAVTSSWTNQHVFFCSHVCFWSDRETECTHLPSHHMLLQWRRCSAAATQYTVYCFIFLVRSCFSPVSSLLTHSLLYCTNSPNIFNATCRLLTSRLPHTYHLLIETQSHIQHSMVSSWKFLGRGSSQVCSGINHKQFVP